MYKEPTLRERIRAFQDKYKLEDDDLILLLIAALEKELTEFSSFRIDLRNSLTNHLKIFNSFLEELRIDFGPENLREIEKRLTHLVNSFLEELRAYFCPENLREIEKRLSHLVEVAEELENIPGAIKFYFQERFEIPKETLEQIVSSTFKAYEKEIRKRDLWVLGSVAVFFLSGGIFLFSWGEIRGKQAALQTVQEIERWQKTAEGQALRELGRLNPHLLDCQGQGLKIVQFLGKRVCKPLGGSRGWILP